MPATQSILETINMSVSSPAKSPSCSTKPFCTHCLSDQAIHDATKISLDRHRSSRRGKLYLAQVKPFAPRSFDYSHRYGMSRLSVCSLSRPAFLQASAGEPDSPESLATKHSGIDRKARATVAKVTFKTKPVS